MRMCKSVYNSQIIILVGVCVNGCLSRKSCSFTSVESLWKMWNYLLSVLVLLLLCLNVWLVFGPATLLGSSWNTLCKKDQFVRAVDGNQRHQSNNCPIPSGKLPSHCRPILDEVDTSKGLVLGTPRKTQVFLSVGFVAAVASEESFVKALNSFFEHVTQEDKNDVIVIIAVSTPQSTYVNLISTKFKIQIDGGWIQVVAPTTEFRNLLGKKNLTQGRYNFTKGFKKHALDLNTKFIFLMEYARKTSRFYLQLSDQTETTMRFLPAVQLEISETNTSQWFGMSFSEFNWVSVGRLYQSRHLRKVTEMGALFHSVMLPFELITSYSQYKISDNVLVGARVKPFSYFKEQRGDTKPKAEVKATMSAFRKPEEAYSDSKGFFWGGTPTPGQHFEIVFDKPVSFTGLSIATGTPLYGDMITDAVLEACIVSQDSQTCESTDYMQLAQFRDPVIELSDLQNTIKGQVKALRISIVKKMETWLIVRDVELWLIK